MRKLACVLMCLFALAAVAQESSSNPVIDAAKQQLQRQSKNLTAAAEEMPADQYSYKPTEGQNTFGHVVMHITQSNNFLCSKISGQAAPAATAKDSDAKDKLLAEMKASFDYCTTAISSQKDSDLGQEVTMFGGRKATKAAAVIAVTNDWADHYSQMAMYLRQKGMTPPTAQRPAPAGEKK